MKACRISASLLLALAAACGPKSPAPNVQCVVDSDCYSGGVCIAGGTCRYGAAVDPQASTIEVSQPTALADGSDKVTITVTLKDSAGNPLVSRGVQLAATGSNNTLTQPALSTNSLGQVTGSLVSTTAEAKVITAFTGALVGQSPTDHSLALKGSAAVTFLADPVHLAPIGTTAGSSTIAVAASDGSAADVVADGIAPVVVKLTVRDVHGNPVAGVPVFIDATGTANTVSPSGVTAADGTWRGVVASTKAETKTLILTAAGLHSEMAIHFHAGPAAAANSTVTVDKATISAVGDASATVAHISIVAQDAFHNPCPAAKVWIKGHTTEVGTFSPTAQELEPATTQPDGTLTLTFSSPRAEPKYLELHLDDAVLNVPTITVNPGPPSPLTSQFQIIGNADDSPVIANGNQPNPHSYVLIVYVADAQDNPIQGRAVHFSHSVPTDILSIGAGQDNGTLADGTFAAGLSAIQSGLHEITASIDGLPDLTATVEFAPGPPDATNSYLTISPDLTAGSVSTDPGNSATVQVTLVDINGNPSPDPVSLDVAPGPGTFTPLVFDGASRFTSQLSSSVASVQTVSATVVISPENAPVVTLPPFTKQVRFVAGAVSAVNSTVVITTVGTPTADGTTTASATVTVRDAQGNPVPGVALVPAVTPVAGVTGLGVSGVTGPDGRGTITFASTVAETKTLAVAATVALAQTAQITFAPGAPAAGSSTFTAAPSTIVDDGRDAATLTLTVRDAHGNPVPGVPLTFASNASASAFNPSTFPILTDAHGVATVAYTTTVASAQVITATAPGYSIGVNLTARLGTADATKSTVSAAPASATADGAHAITVTVTERDGTNNPIVGHSVTVTSSGTAAIAYPSGQTTNASGQITATVTSTVAAPQTLTASDGAPFGSTSVTFTPGAPSSANTTIAAAPTSVVADNSSAITVSVVVKDANRNAAPGVKVSFAPGDAVNDTLSCPAGATCAASATVAGGLDVTTDANGLAAARVVSKKSGSRAVTAAVAGIAAPFSAGVTFTPGAAALLAFSRQPSDVAAGAPISASVQLQDAFGNAVPTASAAVTLALQAAPGTPTVGTLGPPAAVAANTVAGVATFTAATVTNAAGVRQLVASASGLASATSAAFNVIAPFGSDGHNGAFAPGGSMTLPAGVYQYTTISIPAGVRIVSDGNGVLELRASGAVNIGGVIDLSGGRGGNVGSGVNGGGGGGGAGTTAAGGDASYDANNFGGQRAPGGTGGPAATPWAGGGAVGGGGLPGYGGASMGGGGGGGSANGNADMNAGAGSGGGGAAGGAGGFAGADGCVAYGGAGGGPNGGGTTTCGAGGQGGGQACPGPYSAGNGGVGSSPCTTISGSGGGGAIGCDAAADYGIASTLRPGSGGGGGGNGGDSNEPGSGQRSGGGGGGGGGGGALRIVSADRIVLAASAAILANGGRGGNGAVSIDDCNDDAGGGGGGGSGGAIWLQAPVLTVPSGASVSAVGGGGGVAGATNAGASGGAGGLGRIRLSYDPAAPGSGIAGAVTPPLPAGANAAGKAFVAHYPQ